MPPKTAFITHLFGGGWATDFGPTFYGAPGQNENISLPFLTEAQNVIFAFDGGPRKCPGTDAMTDTSVGSSDSVVGVYDYWRQGASGSPVQKIVIHAGTVVYQANLNGTFSSMQTGLESGKAPQYDTFDDLLIYASDSTTDVPRSWDQTTNQNLAGSPPNFAFSQTHKNYQFAAGNASLPSQVNYSVNVNPEDWTGKGSGNIKINPDDGDHITGIISHRNELFLFKGPNKGSIHRITGSSNADFALTTLVEGLGAGWQNTIFRFGTDVGFIDSTGSVRSLDATSSFGDYNEAALSYPIETFMRDELSHDRIRKWWAINDSGNSRVLIACSTSGSTTNDIILCMDYRFMAQGERYPRWSKWDVFEPASLAMIVDTNNKRRPFGGDNAGLLQKYEQATRTANGKSIAYNVKTPFLTYGSEILMKTIDTVSLGIQAKNSNNITLGWERDNQTQQTQLLSQGSSQAILGSFLLGTDTLGGAKFSPRFYQLEEGGTFRAIQYQITDTINGSDLELHSIGANITVDSTSTEN